MVKSIQNADVVARKFWLALTRITNHRLEVTREKQPNKEEMVEKQKIEAIAAKRRKNRGRISLSSRGGKNYEEDIKNDIDYDQANDILPLQFWVAVGGKLQVTKKVRLEMANDKSII